MPTRAVLFDFDGVIADTENHHVAAWQRTLAAIGWELSDESAARAVEVDDRVFLADLFRQRGIEGGDVEGWARKKQSLMRMLLADAPRVYPGVAPLVGRLRGRVALGVVTTTWTENVIAVLQTAGLRDAFRLIVGKEDLTAPKPDPECYLRALSGLGLGAVDVVAMEDSPTGLAAARAAGIRAVAVGHRETGRDWAGDCAYLADLKDTQAVLRVLSLDAI